MKILIDATRITRNKAGLGVYAKNLVDQLISAHCCELFLLTQDDDPDFTYDHHTGVTVIPVSSRLLRRIPLRLLFEQTVLPWLLRKYNIDVVHSLHYSFPLLRPRRAKSVVTIHDMTFLLMPEAHEQSKVRFYRFFLRRSRRDADALIFISHSAQHDYIRLLGVPHGAATVIHHGKDPVFRPLAPQDAGPLTALRARYGLPPRYLLYIGTIEPRKNLERLVDAFAMIASLVPEVALVLAGMMGWKQEQLPAHVRKLGLESRILFPGFIAEADKPLLLAGCAAFVYPSLYEGFGLPVLEALASGAPTVTSNTSSMPEVAGNAAVLIDPLDANALAEAMRSLLLSPDQQRYLHEIGPVQASKFTWEQTAAETADIYRTVTSA